MTRSLIRSFTDAIDRFEDRHGRPPTILFDADGVLYDWEAGFVDAHRRMFPDIPIGEPGTRDRFDFFHGEEHEAQALSVMTAMDYAALGLIPGARDAFLAVLDLGADAMVCTAPTLLNPGCESGKKQAVLRDFGADVADTRLLIQRDKTYALGDILIDDKPAVSGRRTPTWQHVRFTQLYNAALPGARIDSWARTGWAGVLAAELQALVDAPALVL